MLDLYYAIKEHIKEDCPYSISFNDYDKAKEGALCLIFRESGETVRTLYTGKYINKATRFQILLNTGRGADAIIQGLKYLEDLRGELETLTNVNLHTGQETGQGVFIAITSVGSINYIGKNQHDIATYTLNGSFLYKEGV